MALDWTQAVEEENKKNKLAGLSEGKFFNSRTPQSTVKLQEIQDPIINSHGQTTNMAPGRLEELAAMDAKIPKITETPNTQRDLELGKITSSADGDTRSYNIGKNSVSYKLNDSDQQLKTNLEKINEMITSGVEVTPEQMTKIKNLREQAGFLRGGTDRTSSNSNVSANKLMSLGNGLDVTFDNSITPEQRKEFVANSSGVMSPEEAQRRETQHQQWLGRQPISMMKQPSVLEGLLTKENAPNMGWQERKAYNEHLLTNRQAEKNLLATLESNQNTARNNNALEAEKNKITASNNAEQNRLLNLQITAKQERKPESKIVKVSDGMGGTVDEIWTDDGTGKFHKAMNPEQQTANIASNFTPDQRAKAVAYAKANPNIDKATILQKISRGEI